MNPSVGLEKSTSTVVLLTAFASSKYSAGNSPTLAMPRLGSPLAHRVMLSTTAGGVERLPSEKVTPGLRCRMYFSALSSVCQLVAIQGLTWPVPET